MLYAYTDGASNGKKAAIGIALWKDGKLIEEYSANIGRHTNNEAEYIAIITALKKAKKLKERYVVIRTDSQLVVYQLNGRYKVKGANLKKLYSEVCSICINMNVRFEWIERERNRRADALSKEALNVGRE